MNWGRNFGKISNPELIFKEKRNRGQKAKNQQVER